MVSAATTGSGASDTPDLEGSVLVLGWEYDAGGRLLSEAVPGGSRVCNLYQCSHQRDRWRRNRIPTKVVILEQHDKLQRRSLPARISVRGNLATSGRGREQELRWPTFGGSWSTDAPHSIAQVRTQKALPPVWRETNEPAVINYGFSAAFDAGTPVHAGLAAPQKGADGIVYPGGRNQTHIPEFWKSGYEVAAWPLSLWNEEA